MRSPTLGTRARLLTFVLAAFVLHLGAAAAADSPDGLLEQQRELLAGKNTAVSAEPNSRGMANPMSGAGDAQELARRLLLSSATRAPGAARLGDSRRSENWTHTDAQQGMKRVLLGGRDVPAARS
jgi:hypothetical protein